MRNPLRMTRTSITVIAVLLSSGAVSQVTAAPFVIDLSNATDLLRIDSDRRFDYLGQGVTACDFNSDSLLDIAIGASGGDGVGDLRTDAGEVSLIWSRRGRWSGIHSIAALRSVQIIGQDGFDYFGGRLACGDINRDGIPDLIAGAPYGDGPGNVRSDGGQLHLIFGTSPWPSTIDLAVTPGTVIYGSGTTEHLGIQPAVGDINGDGLPDVLVNAIDALNRNKTVSAGRVYAFFNRASWPNEIDLATTPADVTIYGKNLTSFGEDLISGDLDGNGTAEIVAGARFGDTPVSGRKDAGDVFMFRGRASWPSTIDLATQSATTRAYGVDTLDYAGGFNGLAIGDIDNNGVADLAIGLRGADGRTNSADGAGEARLIAPGVSWPATIDLATGTRQVVYGQYVNDVLGTDIYIGDVNGDGTPDLVFSAPGYDGDQQDRPSAGAISVILGRTSFPTQSDFADGDDDWRILGSARDGLRLDGLTDLNADGIQEIVVDNSYTDLGPNSAWFISPVDVDGDGFQQLADNCPLVYNPDQLDSDGDLIGDACQFDYDGDGAPDAQDCAPSNSKLGKPGPIKGVQLVGNSPTTITWLPNSAADSYSVLRGLTSELNGSNYGSCQDSRDPNTSDTTFVENQLPPTGSSFFFLVFGRDAGCGGRGSLGTTSAGVPRVNQNPEDCAP